MKIIIILVSCILSFFATAVMSYIAMATAIGPWITPTVVLSSVLLFKVFTGHIYMRNIAFATVASSVGGIVATALGFSFPALYFLDSSLFDAWLAAPLYFIAVIIGISLAGGWLGMWIANVAEHKLLVEEKLPFPIGELAYSMMVAASNHIRKAYELTIGFLGTMLFCVVQNGIQALQGFIPKTCTIFGPLTLGYVCIPVIRFDLLPIFWAVGFVTGHVIAVPLVVGVLSKILLLEPLNKLSWFSHLSPVEFVLAFCSGMVLAGAVSGFIGLPKQLWRGVKNIKKKINNDQVVSWSKVHINGLSFDQLIELGLLLVFCIFFLTYFGFSFLAQVYLLVFSAICAYQIAAIAGKIGLALLGRYATFVMVPGMLFFGWNSVQLVLVSTFVQIAGGVATDILFGRKIGKLAAIDHTTLKRYQYLGLVVSAISAGIIMWLLIRHFQLGSDGLFAPKAQARRLLIDAKQFDYWVLIIGALFGHLLKKVKINPTLVFGGLLMPVNLVIGLVFGGLCTKLTKDKEAWYPFWSGVFAANSIWMLLQALF